MSQEHLEKLPVNENDFTAVEGWLEQMAQKGYFLNETAWSWWYFTKQEPKNVRYRLDTVTEPKGTLDPQKQEDYEALGWRYVTTHNGIYHIFEAENEEAEELHTDPAVKSLRLEGYEKQMKSIVLASALYLFFVVFFVGRALIRNAGAPALLLIKPEFPMQVMCITFVLYLFVRRVISFCCVRRACEELRAGRNVLPDADTMAQKRHERLVSYVGAALFLLFAIFWFRSCGSGGPVEQQLSYGDVFPALQYLEDGEVRPLDGDWSGNVIYYSSPFLRECYEVDQEGYILREGESEAHPLQEPQTADAVTELKAEFFDVRFHGLALKLSEELREKAEKEYQGLVWQPLPRDGFDEYLLYDGGGVQLLHARIGTKILQLRYKGEAELGGKSEILKEIMNGREPQPAGNPDRS